MRSLIYIEQFSTTNRSLRRSFRVISYRKKKKDKKRKTSGDVSLAKADKEGNDETRALRGMYWNVKLNFMKNYGYIAIAI